MTVTTIRRRPAMPRTTVLDLFNHLVGDLAASQTTHATSSRIK
jgi:hypothetical protein